MQIKPDVQRFGCTGQGLSQTCRGLAVRGTVQVGRAEVQLDGSGVKPNVQPESDPFGDLHAWPDG